MLLRNFIQLPARLRQFTRRYRIPRNKRDIVLRAVLQHILDARDRPGCTCSARLRSPPSSVPLRISGTFTSLKPTCRIFPAFCSRLIAPSDSDTGTFGSIRCNCQRSIRSSFKNRSDSSTCCVRYSGRPTGSHLFGPCRVSPPLVATIDTPSWYQAKAPLQSAVRLPPDHMRRKYR